MCGRSVSAGEGMTAPSPHPYGRRVGRRQNQVRKRARRDCAGYRTPRTFLSNTALRASSTEAEAKSIR